MMWHCGDTSKNIPPYRMIRGSNMREMKVGIQKLSMMKKLVRNLEKLERIVNLHHLLVQNWTSRHVLDIYNPVINLFAFTFLLKVGASRQLIRRLIIIFCVIGRVIYWESKCLRINLSKKCHIKNPFFSCITIVVQIFLLSLKQNITDLLAMVDACSCD